MFVAPVAPAVGDPITAAQAAIIVADIIAGPNMGTPASQAAGTAGTASAGTTEVRDAVLGNYTFTSVAGRRYEAHLNGLVANGSVVGDLFAVNIRNGGASTPTATSPLCATVQAYIPAIGVSGRVTCQLLGSFVPGAGVQTLSCFTVRVLGSGVSTPVSSTYAPRELYVVDVGPA